MILFNDLQVGNVSTTNMTSCRSITAAVDDMTAALDSCSLKDNSRACSITVNIHQEKVEEKGGAQAAQHKSEIDVRTSASCWPCTAGKIGDEG